MSNEKCNLPPGSYKVSKKGYEEIHIPAVSHKGLKDKLVKVNTHITSTYSPKVEDMPKWA